MKNILIILTLWSLHFACNAQNQKDYQALLENYYVSGPGYAAIITRDGVTEFHGAIGLADIENKVELKPEHVFRLGSITKQFTAVAILQLMEQGKIRLDDDITTYISDYPTDGNKICISHLLNHTSGIKSYTNMESWDEELRKQDLTVDEIIAYFKNEPMDFNPGDQFRYNNSGYILLGKIIEIASGKTYEQYVEEEFFKPLGMKDTYYGRNSEIINDRARGYQADESGEYINAPYLSMSQPYAAGSIISTTHDLSIWNQAVFNYELVTKESLALAHTSTILNSGEEVPYGFGWRFNRLKGSHAINHGGGINGFSTHAAYFPEEKVFVAVLSNCTSNDPSFLMRQLGSLAIGKPMEMPNSVLIDQALLDSYTGSYQLGPDFLIKITSQEGKLFAQATGQSILPLIPVSDDRFKAPQVDAELRFIQKDGKVESLMLFQNGEHIAKKIVD